jgi:hypothetical protein
MLGWVIVGTIICVIIFITCIIIWINRQSSIDSGGTRKRILLHYDRDTKRMRIFSLRHTMKDKNYEFASEGKSNTVYLKAFMKSIPLKLNQQAVKYEDKYNTYIFNDGFVSWLTTKLSDENDLLQSRMIQLEGELSEAMTKVNELETKYRVNIRDEMDYIADTSNKFSIPLALKYKKR